MAYQPDLGASPAELVLGTCPKVPGDLIREGDPEGADVTDLVEAMRANADRPAVQTTHHRVIPTYWPSSAEDATHVWLKKGKPTPLGSAFAGPYRILERLGDSCLKLKMGAYVSGVPRTVVAHWNNCKPAVLAEGVQDAQAPALGRPKKKTTGDGS